MRRVVTTNETMIETLRLLRSKAREKPVWGRVAELLSRPARRRPQVNLSKINRYASDGDFIIVPGKVLGTGKLNKKVTVAAFTFSAKAAQQITSAGGRILTLRDAVNEVQDYTKVKVLV
ncbi:Ribosomal protein L15 [Acidilobus saccharovorans 345-15]|uniref:Large ribosomal subunit protein eL18 n=1 Tax=Acidilobus saccharovorans (strain DSM 16705 / JCM 18335 / VKM B-2471 / 345-15) TaxID=666510 RepID=D9Q274_ACIS3|nr:50S ribosomal protein L18e [Acidilobus saccharovorans]ADL19412.1 Ribosomal protein L15 [Acidilobus saccharovorans 345-15]